MTANKGLDNTSTCFHFFFIIFLLFLFFLPYQIKYWIDVIIWVELVWSHSIKDKIYILNFEFKLIRNFFVWSNHNFIQVCFEIDVLFFVQFIIAYNLHLSRPMCIFGYTFKSTWFVSDSMLSLVASLCFINWTQKL